ncbi:NBS-LRR type resistance protein [Cucumis melo var. makuwa]|uniref:NBS-LRR type resistance protein n=1 Tax=Cucumis melo var. makuwa TaxID=1194695 RepID=A0A5D3CBN9_CUCMM|nr:NBS-LRR type resistance protein [Cucumis melo var. makuwa]
MLTSELYSSSICCIRGSSHVLRSGGSLSSSSHMYCGQEDLHLHLFTCVAVDKSSGSVERTYQSSAPEGCTYQSCAPEGCTYQSSAPEGCTYQSSAPEGCTYQSSAPEGCTHQSSAPEGCTYP